VGAGETKTVLLPLAKSHGWYDASVRVGDFEQRFAGRVETGKDGMSDPAMA
jgi:phospholipase C